MTPLIFLPERYFYNFLSHNVTYRFAIYFIPIMVKNQ